MDIFCHRGHHKPSILNAAAWSTVWIVISILFAGVTAGFIGPEKAWLYLKGWLMEKTLAVDNLFAFLAIFASFGLMTSQHQYVQHRILHWGIIGAIALRAVLLAGIGLLLSLTGVWHMVIMSGLAAAVLMMALLMFKAAFGEEKEDVDYSQHWSVRLVRRIFPVKASVADGKFFVREDGRLYVTIPFLALVCIEFVDVGFAFDSMPAIAAVVRDPVIMLTGTMMAVAGLRALYFLLLGMSNKLCHLDKAVAGLLVWIAVKIMLDAFHVLHLPNAVNFAIVLGFIGLGIIASLLWPEQETNGRTETSRSGEESPGSAACAAAMMEEAVG